MRIDIIVGPFHLTYIHPSGDEIFLDGRKFEITGGGGWEGEISQGVVKFSLSEGSVPVDEIF